MNNSNHLITGLIMLVVALVSWVGLTVVESSKNIATLQKDSEFMKENVNDMKHKLTNLEKILISRQYAVIRY